MRVPEEINRKIVDHIADINMTYSSIAREYLVNEGLPRDLVIKIGSPMKEVLNYYEKKIDNSNIIQDLNLKNRNYFLVSVHREENIESKNFDRFVSIINSIEEKFKFTSYNFNSSKNKK